MSEHISTVGDDGFETDVLGSDKPVLVDFWAEWCGPCKAIAPVLEELAAEYQDRIQVTKMDVDGNPETPRKFGIRGIPTLILFRDGEAVAKVVGAQSKAQLTAFLEQNL